MKGDAGDDNDEEEATENGAVGDEGLRWLKVAASASVVAGTDVCSTESDVGSTESDVCSTESDVRSTASSGRL